MPGFRKKSRRNRSNRRNIKKRQSRRNRTNGGRRYRHRGGADTTQTEFEPEVVESNIKIKMGDRKFEVTTDADGKMKVTATDTAPADLKGPPKSNDPQNIESESTANANTNNANDVTGTD